MLLPAHLGALGPAATPERRAWWDGADRRAAKFEDVVLPRLTEALRREVGAARVDDLGGGRWRDALGWDRDPPPTFAMQERRKYLASDRDRAVFVRFAGIGPHGEATLERGRVLAEAGWSPEPRPVFPGFLATACAVAAQAGGRPSVAMATPSISEVRRYLAFRAAVFPAREDDGAPAERLVEMIRVNAREAFGSDAERSADALAPAAREAGPLPRVAVDAKLERWEWTRSPEGRPWKLDAVDHAFGHDLVGCQPITWDVVGARVELGWTPDEAVSVAAKLLPGATRGVLALHEAAYLAHRVARWTFARDQEADGTERARIDRALARYRALLRARLGRAAAYP